MDSGVPPRPTPSRLTAVRVLDHWYPVCESKNLRAGLVARELFAQPLVLFRDAEGRAFALLDRCPHRSIPLSQGRLVDRRLECGYHGWQFDGDGTCLQIPGLCGGSPGKAHRATPFSTREHDGLIWVWGRADSEPTREPFTYPEVGEGYTSVREVVEAEGGLHATIENALDVPHTAFLHRGLFRGSGTRNRIKVVVTRSADRVQAQYLGEPRPEGVVGRLLSPSGGVVDHYDRFILPSVSQVEYRIGTENHILVTAVGCPVSDFRTRLYAQVQYRLRLPGWLVRPVITPIARHIFRQDAVVLKRQSEAIRCFGGERFASTELDVLGAQILRLMRKAAEPADSEDANEDPDAQWRRELEMEV